MKKPIPILNAFFGRKDQQSLGEFAREVKDLKADPDAYKEVVDLAAAALGEEVDWS